MILEVQSRRMPADKPFCRSMPSIPFALEHRANLDAPADGRPRDNERSRMELLNHFPTRVFHAAMVGEFGGGLGYARCRSLRPPPDRACRCLSVEPRAEPSDHGAPFRTVACCFSDGVVISPAGPDCGERQQIPSPGAGGRQRNCKCQKNQERNASTQVSQTLPKQKVGDSAVRYRTLRTNRYQGNQGSIIEMRSRPPNTTTTTMMPRAATYAMRRHAGADMSRHQYCVGEPPRRGSHQQPRRAVDPQCLGPWTFSSHDPLSPTAPPYRFLASYDTIPRNLCRRNAPPWRLTTTPSALRLH